MNSRLPAFVAAGVVFLLDRLSKLLIETRVSTWETIEVFPGFFNIVHTRNPGAAFSLLADAHPLWRTALLLGLSCGAVVLIAALLWRSPISRRPLYFGLALMLGGAAGNLFDRLVYGEVTDFLEFYLGRFRWPAFNLADSAITLGAALTMWSLWRERAEPERS